MNVIIRIIQVLLALAALNGAYGLAVQVGFSSVSDKSKPSLWNVVGSVVTVLVLGCIIFLLQRYYELRNKSQTRTNVSTFMGVALTSTSIAALIGFSFVILIVAIAVVSL